MQNFIVDVWQGSEYASDFEYAIILNVGGSEYTRIVNTYARVLNMLLVLNMPGFWIYLNSKYARITQGFEYA